MVLNLKVWKSRSLPGLPRTERFIPHHDDQIKALQIFPAGLLFYLPSNQLHSQFAADDAGGALQAFDGRAAVVGIE
jgi:hypothetical protein